MESLSYPSSHRFWYILSMCTPFFPNQISLPLKSDLSSSPQHLPKNTVNNICWPNEYTHTTVYAYRYNSLLSPFLDHSSLSLWRIRLVCAVNLPTHQHIFISTIEVWQLGLSIEMTHCSLPLPGNKDQPYPLFYTTTPHPGPVQGPV